MDVDGKIAAPDADKRGMPPNRQTQAAPAAKCKIGPESSPRMEFVKRNISDETIPSATAAPPSLVPDAEYINQKTKNCDTARPPDGHVVPPARSEISADIEMTPVESQIVGDLLRPWRGQY